MADENETGARTDTVERTEDLARAQARAAQRADPEDTPMEDETYDATAEEPAGPGGEAAEADEDGESGEEDGEAGQRAVPQLPKVARKKKDAAERIKELSAARRKAEDEAFAAELRAQELERRLQERDAAKQAPALPPEPNADDFSYGEADPAYMTAMVDHRVAKQLAEREQKAASERAVAEAETRKAEAIRRANTAITEGEAKHPGFRKLAETTPWDPEVAVLVMDSENNIDIAWRLMNNVSELRELTKADRDKRLRMIGRLEAASARPSAVKGTQAPAPSRRSAQSVESADSYPTFEDFEKAFYRK